MSTYGYLRVSKHDGSQTNETQRPDVERLASARGLPLVRVFEDEMSGAKQSRPGLDAMLKVLRAGDTLIVFRLDRLGRSMLNVINLVGQLDARGVRLVSVAEPWLDTTGPMRSLLLSIFAWFAEYERASIVERTRAGIARAKSEGIHCGRPKGSKDAKPRRVRSDRGVRRGPRPTATEATPAAPPEPLQ